MDVVSQIRMVGYTLIELVMVVLIIGIIAVSVMPKWTATSLGLEFEARRLLNDVRIAQMMSVATGQRYRWVRQSSNSYSILNQSGSAIVLPSGGTTFTFTSGVSFGTITNLPSNLVAFDSRGIPYTTTAIPGTALASTASIPVTLGGQTRTITISAQTGYGALS